MTNIALVILVLVVAWYVISLVRRHQRGIVAQRGLSIGADLGALSDQARVRVKAVTVVGPDRVHLLLSPDTDPADGRPSGPATDLDLVVLLKEDEFGFELLQEWKRRERPVAIVVPPGSRIVRLRSPDDLQPLTLRRVDDE